MRALFVNAVIRRHVYYAATIVNVILLAKSPAFLAIVLCCLLVVVVVDASANIAFVSANALLFPLVEHVAVRYSPHTWRYAHPMDFLSLQVPVWLLPLWGLASIWISDIFLLTGHLFEKHDLSE